MIPAAVGYALLAGPIVALVAEHGAVAAADRDLLSRTLAAFALGLPFFSVFQLLTRTFYATHDARTPALVNIGAAVVNLGADLVFAFGFHLGVPGLALGHALSYAVGSAALLFLVRRKLGGIDGAPGREDRGAHDPRSLGRRRVGGRRRGRSSHSSDRSITRWSDSLQVVGGRHGRCLGLHRLRAYVAHPRGR